MLLITGFSVSFICICFPTGLEFLPIHVALIRNQVPLADTYQPDSYSGQQPAHDWRVCGCHEFQYHGMARSNGTEYDRHPSTMGAWGVSDRNNAFVTITSTLQLHLLFLFFHNINGLWISLHIMSFSGSDDYNVNQLDLLISFLFVSLSLTISLSHLALSLYFFISISHTPYI